MNMPVLAIRNLVISKGQRRLVDGVSLTLAKGRTLGIIGESGSGKSLTALAITHLLPDGLAIAATSSIQIDGVVLPTHDAVAMRALRGAKIAMVFQDPMACLNPFMRVGSQIDEILAKGALARPARAARIVELLREVDLPDPATCAR
ncbi:MAG TPA: ATP-binding cassette domain-containing protein, partial [Ancylobacter sp.]